MALIHLQQFTFAFPDGFSLFHPLQFTHAQGRSALVGDNGSGKSTLLRLIRDQAHSPLPGLRVEGRLGWLPQNPTAFHGQSVWEVAGLHHLIPALRRTLDGHGTVADLETIGDAWDAEDQFQLEMARWHLGHLEGEQLFETLSGGEQTRLLLSICLRERPDFLLLDEPTNHLDASGRDALYQWLASTPQSVVVASHDPELLRHVDRIYELADGNGRLFHGNFDHYQAERQAERQRHQVQFERAQKDLRRASARAQRSKERQEKHQTRGKKQGIQAGMGKMELNTLKNSSERSGAARERVQDKLVMEKGDALKRARQVLNYQRPWRIDAEISQAAAGRIMAEAQGLNYQFPAAAAPLWPEGLDFTWRGQDRVHIVGGNGSGKSTLLDLVLGSRAPLRGRVRLGAQFPLRLDQQLTLLDRRASVRANFERHFRVLPPEHELRLRLDRFRFGAEMLDRLAGQLSGGQAMRLALACVLATDRAPDLLLLDEPTNHLDLSSKEIFRDFLAQYPGCLVVISHDRLLLEGLDFGYKLILERD